MKGRALIDNSFLRRRMALKEIVGIACMNNGCNSELCVFFLLEEVNGIVDTVSWKRRVHFLGVCIIGAEVVMKFDKIFDVEWVAHDKVESKLRRRSGWVKVLCLSVLHNSWLGCHREGCSILGEKEVSKWKVTDGNLLGSEGKIIASKDFVVDGAMVKDGLFGKVCGGSESDSRFGWSGIVAADQVSGVVLGVPKFGFDMGDIVYRIIVGKVGRDVFRL